MDTPTLKGEFGDCRPGQKKKKNNSAASLNCIHMCNIYLQYVISVYILNSCKYVYIFSVLINMG